MRYTPSDDDVHAVIRLDGPARWVAEYYPVEVLDDDPDGMTIRMSVGDAAVAARLLVRLGGSAELVEGAEVAPCNRRSSRANPGALCGPRTE